MLKMAHVLRYSVPFAAARSRGMDSFAAAQKTSEGGFASCEGDQRFEYRAPSRARAEAKAHMAIVDANNPRCFKYSLFSSCVRNDDR